MSFNTIGDAFRSTLDAIPKSDLLGCPEQRTERKDQQDGKAVQVYVDNGRLSGPHLRAKVHGGYKSAIARGTAEKGCQHLVPVCLSL